MQVVFLKTGMGNGDSGIARAGGCALGDCGAWAGTSELADIWQLASPASSGGAFYAVWLGACMV
ncbi:hypothetical protein AEA00_10900 [Xanthomonas campestris pv. campestris]|nr:hypothetical protein AEA00_10900 [Xanthomonas campestris pv. campestris]